MPTKVLIKVPFDLSLGLKKIPALWIIVLSCISTIHLGNDHRGVNGFAVHDAYNEYRETASSPCRYSVDKDYVSGILVDCRNLALTKINSSWIPVEATTILLTQSKIESVDKDHFSHATNLRVLDIRDNDVTKVDVEAFKELKYLKKLDLEQNKICLEYGSFDARVFQGLENLLDLRLAFNENENVEGQYPSDLFRDLTNLRYLSLDTFAGDLNFGELFRMVLNLTSLRLTGGFNTLTNRTFQSFEKIPLESLTISWADYLTEIELDAFSHLKVLHEFQMENTPLGVSKSLLSLYQFQNRNFTSIKFDRINNHALANEGKDGVYDGENGRFLATICVKHFSLTHSQVLVITMDAMPFALWGKCLESLDFSRNPLLGQPQVLWRLHRLFHLKHLTIEMSKLVLSGAKDKDRKWFYESCYKVNEFQTNTKNSENSKKDVKSLGQLRLQTETKVAVGNHQAGHNADENKYPTSACPRHIVPPISIFPFPPRLETFVYNSIVDFMGKFDSHIRLTGSSHLKELSMSNNGIEFFTGRFDCVSNVIRLDFSFNDGSVMSPTFFDTFEGVKMLNLAGMNLNSHFMITNSARLFQNLNKLQVLDLSKNQLKALSPLSFGQNTHLVFLNLNKNKFDKLPCDLNILSNLFELNLEENSISYLPKSDIASIENHYKKMPSFRLNLSGNLLLCDCRRIGFLAWLQRTQISLPGKDNYMCLDGDGKLVKAIEGRDLNAMWRICIGKDAFFVSIILWVLTILSFLIFVLCVRSKTLIKTVILQTISSEFSLKRLEDYKYGGFLGYAAADSTFACLTLRKFIENDLKLTTYLRDRDLLPSSGMAESIVDAINSSWRLVFVGTKDFLYNDDWAYFTLKTAAYSVTAANSRRIILLVERDCLHMVPRSLLRAVHEDNIIFLEKPFRLDYALRESLKESFSAVSHG